MENITADGKIKTIRCVKATHEDFAKLVQLGKDAKKELETLEKQWGYNLYASFKSKLCIPCI